ncbi:MAG: thiamine pyrophosphate-dependent enzyme [Kordiimonas sp.]
MDENYYQVYRSACQIRAFEDAIAAAADKGLVPGFAHLCTGAEVLEAALCASLYKSDYVTGSHRSHGLAIGCGADPYATAAEIFGNADGLSGGIGGTQHLIAPDSGFLTSNGIVGAQVPLAAGAALTARTLGNNGIGIAVFGDGAANQGSVLETMNLAAALELPLLFVLENNGLGQSTSSSYASGGISLSDRARAFGLRTEALTAQDIDGILKGIPKLLSEVRTACKPIFLEAFVPRLSGHYHGEKQDFSEGDRNGGDPLVVLETLLEAESIPLSPSRTIIETEIKDEVGRAALTTQASPNTLSHWETSWRIGK